MTKPSAPLTGLCIAVTRPTRQAAALIERIRAAGGEAIALPLLEIVPPEEPLDASALRDRMARAGIVIFISPNAVRMALRILPAAAWPTTPRLAAIGKGTARVLGEAGFHEVIVPDEGADSDALLARPEFANVPDQTILLVRGEGGRELLARTLETRGAKVEHAIVYRRQPVPPNIAELRATEAAILLVTSSEALRVLLKAARTPGDVAWLRARRYVFGHPRIAALGQARGLHGIITDSPEDDALYTALVSLALQEESPP
ncbi:MAG: uroporphyrinogen-III synthase [Pseudomonadota bacterium]